MQVLQVLQEKSHNTLSNRFKQALKDNKTRDALKLLIQFPSEELFNHNDIYLSPFEMLIADQNNHPKVFDALCLLVSHTPDTLLEGLHLAIEKHAVEYAVKIIRQLPTSVLNKKIKGYSALTALLRHGSDYQSLCALLDKGVNVNAIENGCNVAVVTACKYEQSFALDVILNHISFDLSTINRGQHGELLISILKKCTPLSMIKTLLNRGVSIYPNGIICSVIYAPFEVTLLLIERINLERLQSIDNLRFFMSNFFNQIIDHYHSHIPEKIVPMMKTLQARGFDWYYCSHNSSSLNKAIRYKNLGLSACEYLIANAPPGYLDKPLHRQEQTALMLAISLGNLKVVKLLLQHGVNIHALDSEGNSALMIAFKHGDNATCEEVMAHCTSDMFTQKNTAGESPISIAHQSLLPCQHRLGIKMMTRLPLKELNLYDFLKCFDQNHTGFLQQDLLRHFRREKVVCVLEKAFLDEKVLRDEAALNILADEYRPQIKLLLIQLSKYSNAVVLASLKNMLAKTTSYLNIKLQFELIRGIAIQTARLNRPENHALIDMVHTAIDILAKALHTLPDNHSAFIDCLSKPSTLGLLLSKIEVSEFIPHLPENRLKAQSIINAVIPESYPQDNTKFQVCDFTASSLLVTAGQPHSNTSKVETDEDDQLIHIEYKI